MSCNNFTSTFRLGDSFPDAVLQTTDGQQVYAHQIVLKMHPGKLYDLVDGAEKTAAKMHNTRAVVDIPATRAVVCRLLTLMYPLGIADDAARGLEGLIATHYLAKELDVSSANILISYILMANTDADPHKVFVMASHMGYVDVARHAARSALKLPLISSHVAFHSSDPEFETVHMATFLKLGEFHQDASSAAASAIGNFASVVLNDPEDVAAYIGHGESWWAQEGHAAGCGAFMASDGSDGMPTVLAPAKWFAALLVGVESEVRTTPTRETAAAAVMNWSGVVFSMSRCSLCTRAASSSLPKLARRIGNVVHKEIESVAGRYEFLITK
ncbi:hypothetical protein FB45DRAFT_865767 [Roridomyces roridus]|uniref:BTB domain-containing protein n=1 Tax=Roridomyces roridus TaxID=1738132 RepID=A0AAD7C018_9AGAR|nr:hypothetical protein FB45DRAFT_865767 [Roridomyces roridus]